MKSKILAPALALAAVTMLGGCGVFGGKDKKPKTPVLGDRLPVLNAETGAEVDPVSPTRP